MSDSSTIPDLDELLPTLGRPALEDCLFSSQADWWNNACVSWYPDGWGIYSSGYKEAADHLAHRVEETRTGQDTLVYPVLFLYRQYLELQLKDLIQQGRRLTNVSEKFPLHHDIGKLWIICHDLLSRISPGDSVAELNQISRLISEFAAVDPISMAFRYPQDKDGKPSLPGIDHINLRNVREVIGKISNILQGASYQLGEYLSIKQELEREFHGE